MINDLYSLLQKDIQNQIGKKVLYSKNCDLLSKEIYLKIRRRISSSTIKRFFGIVKNNFKPSKYTLDTFCQFLGYKDWNNYVSNYQENYSFSSAKNSWYKLKNQMRDITNQSLVSLKQKTNYDSKKIFLRDFAKKKFEDFMESSKNALMFVAPDGFGKSGMIIHLAEHYFLNENAKYKNDAVGLVDGEIFFNLYSRNKGISLLSQILDFKINSSIGLYFINHPEQRKGRIVGIIDNVDEIFSDTMNYHNLVDNISKIILANNYDWFKMVLTCRPENLDPFIYHVNKNPIFKSSWFDLNFTSEHLADTINIPFFEKKEIESVLNETQYGFDYQHLAANNKNILSVISYPYLLFLYLDELAQGNKEISEINLLKRYVQSKLNSMPYREGKISIIEHFIKLSEWGKESYSVKKKHLLLAEHCIPAYEELITQGIIYEYTDAGKLLSSNTYVRFNQNFIFEYILFEKWRVGRELSAGLFFEIREYYINNSQLQCNLLNFFTRTLIHSSKYDVIKEIHIEFEKKIPGINSHAQIPPCLSIFSVVVQDAFRTNLQFKNELAPWICNSNLGKILYS